MLAQIFQWILNNPKTTQNIISAGQFVKQEIDEYEKNQSHEQHLTDAEKKERAQKKRFFTSEAERVRPIIIRSIRFASNKSNICESTPMSDAGVSSSKLMKILDENGISYDSLGIRTTWRWGSNVSQFAEYICNLHCENAYRIKDL